MAIFCCVAGISVIPACHWVWLNGGIASDVVQVSTYRAVRKQTMSACFCIITFFFTPRINNFSALLREMFSSGHDFYLGMLILT